MVSPSRKGCSDIGRPLHKNHLKVPFSLEQGTKRSEVGGKTACHWGNWMTRLMQFFRSWPAVASAHVAGAMGLLEPRRMSTASSCPRHWRKPASLQCPFTLMVPTTVCHSGVSSRKILRQSAPAAHPTNSLRMGEGVLGKSTSSRQANSKSVPSQQGCLSP